jgi:hypothetical protein
MATYPDSLTLREARASFFAQNIAVFGADGGYSKKWVKMEIGPLPLYLPNSKGRLRAVQLHDLHHIATGYQTNLTGEAEIGAWEVGSGCGTFYHAWALNMGAFAIGLVIAPRRTFRAFVRGLHSDNLYHHGAYDEAMLDHTVGSLRSRLRLHHPIQPNTTDTLRFIAWSSASVLALLAGGAPFVAVAVAWLIL